MLARISTVFYVLLFTIIALAMPSHHIRHGGGTTNVDSSSSQCNTGGLQCCESTHDPSEVLSDTAPLGIIAVLAGGLLGVNCSPLVPIGVGSGANCQQQPVCCENNTFNGLINIGCSPIDL